MKKKQARKLEKLLKRQAREVVDLLFDAMTDEAFYYLDPEIYIIRQDRESLEDVGPAAGFHWDAEKGEFVFEVYE